MTMKNVWHLKGYDTVNRDAVYHRPGLNGILKISKATYAGDTAPATLVLDGAVLANPKAAPKVQPAATSGALATVPVQVAAPVPVPAVPAQPEAVATAQVAAPAQETARERKNRRLRESRAAKKASA
jgi:hypothetical protein